MTNEIEPTEPVLETYNTNWRERHAAAYIVLQSAQQATRDAYKANDGSAEATAKILATSKIADAFLQELYAASHAQHRTASDYMNWCRKQLEEQAEMQGKTLALPVLPKGSTIEEINGWMARGYKSLEEQDYHSLPVGQPDGVDAFHETLASGRTRSSFHLKFSGNFGFPSEARCTLEQASDKAFVCFHHIPDARGTSPTNAIEDLATNVRATFLPHLDPDAITFYVHIPSLVGGSVVGEAFILQALTWYGDHFDEPIGRQFYKQIPAGLRAADNSPYDPMPNPPASPERSEKTDAGLLQSGLARFLRRNET